MSLKWFLKIILICSVVICCNYNPLGGKSSHVGIGNNPFLKTPGNFSVISARSMNSNSLINKEATLVWTVSDFADNYTISYGNFSGVYTEMPLICTSVTGTSCTITQLINGNTYYFNIIARNFFGMRNVANEVSIKILPNTVYITSAADGTLRECFVDLTSGLFNNCSIIVTGLANPIAVYVYNSNAYVVSHDSSSSLKCPIDNLSGVASNCINAITDSSSNLVGAHGIIPYGNYFYIANLDGSTLSRCSINSLTGDLTGCVNPITDGSGTAILSPVYVNVVNNNLFISNEGDNKIIKCSLNSSSGNVTNCTNAVTDASLFVGPRGL